MAKPAVLSLAGLDEPERLPKRASEVAATSEWRRTIQPPCVPFFATEMLSANAVIEIGALIK
jgi:hypothetical protein